jgi:hypothetical protein
MYVHNAYDGRVMAESMGYERLPWALEWQRME